MITEIKGTCQFKGCERPAEFIAAGNNKYYGLTKKWIRPVGCYCSEHAELVANEGEPEYSNTCPNCGCRHGVN